jgi:hypothetical protein
MQQLRVLQLRNKTNIHIVASKGHSINLALLELKLTNIMIADTIVSLLTKNPIKRMHSQQYGTKKLIR